MHDDPLEQFVHVLKTPGVLADERRQKLKRLLSDTVCLETCGVYVEDCYTTLFRLVDELDAEPSTLQRRTLLKGIDALRDEMRLETAERAADILGASPSGEAPAREPGLTPAYTIARYHRHR